MLLLLDIGMLMPPRMMIGITPIAIGAGQLDR